MPESPAAPPAGLDDARLNDVPGADRFNLLSAVSQVVSKTLVIAELELRKLRHDPTELLSRAIQPSLWLLIFGQVLAHSRAIPTGNVGYIDFLTPGILAQSALIVAIFHGLAIIWEKDLGILHKFLASPAPRVSLILGKALSAGLRGCMQAVLIYGLGFALGVRFNLNPLAILGVLAIVVLGASCFAIISLILACIVKTRERFMGLGQAISMPLFFASNAIYPIALMPGWLQVVSRMNPLTYEVDALRSLMIAGGTGTFGLGYDFAVLIAATAIGAAVGARMYPNVVT